MSALSTRMSRTLQRWRRPTVTALLLGGAADARTCQVPAGAAHVLVTMIDGTAQGPPIGPYTGPFMDRAEGTWEMYAPLQGVPPDRTGRLPYRVTRALPLPPDAPALLVTADLVLAIERELALVGGTQQWELLRRHLASAGYTLPDS